MTVICWRVTRTYEWHNHWHWNGPCLHPLPSPPEEHVTTINANRLPASIEPLFFWPAVPSHLHWGFINSDHVIPMLMAFNEIGEWNAFPFNILWAAILFQPMVSIQGSWKERWSSAHPSHSPSMCRFQHRQEQKEGKNFVVSLMQETHPSPTDRQRHGTAPGQLVKQGEKKIWKVIAVI